MRRKDPEKEAAIINAAIAVFASQGFHAAKMSKIAEEAGVAAGSLYLYFENKDAILNQIITATWQQMIEGYRKTVEQKDLSAPEKLEGLIDLVFNMFMDDPARSIIFVHEQHHLEQKGQHDFAPLKTQLLELGAQVIEEGVAAGQFDPRVEIRLFKEFLFGGMHHLLNLWALNPEHMNLEDIREQIKPIIANAIRK